MSREMELATQHGMLSVQDVRHPRSARSVCAQHSASRGHLS